MSFASRSLRPVGSLGIRMIKTQTKTFPIPDEVSELANERASDYMDVLEKEMRKYYRMGLWKKYIFTIFISICLGVIAGAFMKLVIYFI